MLTGVSEKMATQNGLEPSTSSVTGWRSNQLNYWATSSKQTALRSQAACADCSSSLRCFSSPKNGEHFLVLRGILKQSPLRSLLRKRKSSSPLPCFSSPNEIRFAELPFGFAGDLECFLFLQGMKKLGGNNRTRTCDILLVRQALYQLSYAPENRNGRRLLYKTFAHLSTVIFRKVWKK